jgi:hypothetical protein
MTGKPSGAGAVMAQRGTPKVPEALDYFPTPPWAARAGGDLIRRLDPAARSCWEPACGEGHMAAGLADYFETVLASDVHDYGDPFGVFAELMRRPPRGATKAHAVGDFLDEEPGLAIDPDWIVSNPPFVRGEAFVRQALKHARRGVAMLCRSVFLESAARFPLFARQAGFALVAQFAERVPMVKGRWDPDASTATSYAWFIWLKPRADLPSGCWPEVGGPLGGAHFGLIIPPGAKQRFSRPEDLARFCSADRGELFA